MRVFRSSIVSASVLAVAVLSGCSSSASSQSPASSPSGPGSAPASSAVDRVNGFDARAAYDLCGSEGLKRFPSSVGGPEHVLPYSADAVSASEKGVSVVVGWDTSSSTVFLCAVGGTAENPVLEDVHPKDAR